MVEGLRDKMASTNRQRLGLKTVEEAADDIRCSLGNPNAQRITGFSLLQISGPPKTNACADNLPSKMVSLSRFMSESSAFVLHSMDSSR